MGLLYGPSGCGKSSLVKAGLLPLLADNVIPIYVEATPDETETALLRSLRHRFPRLSAGATLAETFGQLRQGGVLPPGKKAVVVIDQFEQWLHGRTAGPAVELVLALRQCDGEHIQGLLMVRDDFWLSISRFFRSLEVRLVDGQNAALVDRFDPAHARAVLIAYGQAYGRLPADPQTMSSDQSKFLDAAIASLAQEGRVIPVLISLLAEVMKAKPWLPDSLRVPNAHAGGIGAAFLEETFSAALAPERFRRHQRAVRAVLERLLPETGLELKGHRRSREDLLAASGYARRPNDFNELLHILDQELRLVTPILPDEDGADGEDQAADSGTRYYQLTHDYTVPSLRLWLGRKRRETARGRAGLVLAEYASLWNSQIVTRRLPSWREWASIRTLTRPGAWSDAERSLMRSADRRHGAATAVIAGLFGLALFLAWRVHEGVAENHGRQRAEVVVAAIRDPQLAHIAWIEHEYQENEKWIEPVLLDLINSPTAGANERLRARLILLAGDPTQLAPIREALLAADADTVVEAREALMPYRPRLEEAFWTRLLDTRTPLPERLRLAGILAGFAPADDRWARGAEAVVPALTAVNVLHLGDWLDALKPVAANLRPPLLRLFRATASTPHRTIIARILVACAADPRTLPAEVLRDAGTEA